MCTLFKESDLIGHNSHTNCDPPTAGKCNTWSKRPVVWENQFCTISQYFMWQSTLKNIFNDLFWRQHFAQRLTFGFHSKLSWRRPTLSLIQPLRIEMKKRHVPSLVWRSLFHSAITRLSSNWNWQILYRFCRFCFCHLLPHKIKHFIILIILKEPIWRKDIYVFFTLTSIL